MYGKDPRNGRLSSPLHNAWAELTACNGHAHP
jgi:hypothetical protein